MTSEAADDLTHLLLTNDPPSPLETELARSIIAGLDRLLDEDVAPDTEKHRIANTEEQLDDKTRERKAIEAKRARYLAILSPHRRLPIEVLGLIIEETVSRAIHAFGTGLVLEHAVYSLMLVSRTWYQAALSIPNIWRRLEVMMSPPDPTADSILSPAQCIRMWTSTMEMWFARARDAPLILSLDFSDEWEIEEGDVVEFSAALAALSARIRSFAPSFAHIDCCHVLDGAVIPEVVFEEPVTPVVWQRLQCFWIQETSPLRGTFQHADRFPSLQQAGYWGTERKITRAPFPLPFGQLNTLLLVGFHPNYAQLSESVALEQLDLRVRQLADGPHVPWEVLEQQPPLIFPKLTKLSLHAVGPQSAWFYRNIRSPLLEKLRVRAPYNLKESISWVTELVRGCGSQGIKRLALWNRIFTPGESDIRYAIDATLMQSIFERTQHLVGISLSGGLWLTNIHSVPTTVRKVKIEDSHIQPWSNQPVMAKFEEGLVKLVDSGWTNREPMQIILKLGRARDLDIHVWTERWTALTVGSQIRLSVVEA